MDPAFALVAAVDRGDVAGAAELLADHPSAIGGRFHGATALHRAAARGDLAMLVLLLERGADPDDTDEGGATPLAWATDEERDEVVDLLLVRGARPSAVDLAARGLVRELAKLLDESPWMLDQHTAQGTPLHAAVRRGRVDAVRLLVERGAELSEHDDEGRTPLELVRTLRDGHAAAPIEALLSGGSAARADRPAHEIPASDEVSYRCGACAEQIVIDVDRTEGEQQSFVEDCPVCCRANVIAVSFDPERGASAIAELE